MSNEALNALQERVDAAEQVDAALLEEAAGRLRDVFPRTPSQAELGSERAEAVLKLIDHCLPGWSIALRGTATEPHHHWHCTLRESDARDNDAVIGNGNAPSLSLALLRALVSAAHTRT